MKEELQKKLFEYPMFVEHTKSCTETCMCWGIETDDGWYHLLNSMCQQLLVLQEKYRIKVIFDQVKEKLGTLRVYWHLEYEEGWTSEVKNHAGLISEIWKLGRCFTRDPKGWRYHLRYAKWYRMVLDGNPNTEYSSCGWTHHGTMVPIERAVDREVGEVISAAEHYSSLICEHCGMTGAETNQSGWLVTLCPKCRVERT